MNIIKLDENNYINKKWIVNIEIVNLNKQRQQRGNNFISYNQKNNFYYRKNWQVSIYIKSDSDGYNPQRFLKFFPTQKLAQEWVNNALL